MATMNPWRAANADTLNALRPDIDGATIRKAWRARTMAELIAVLPAAATIGRDHYRAPTLANVKREAITTAAGYYGLEYLGRCNRTGASVYYANAGDTYTATLIFTGPVLRVSSWGDLIESRAVSGRE